ncbi:UNVERIFIED_CONTAM: hypothetical protein FKN15_048628 [Acipenser sinensis]
MNRSVLVPLFLVLLTGLCRAEQPDSSLLNEEVKRTVDLSSHLAKITADITVSNPGASAAQSFLIALDPELQSHLAYIGVIVSDQYALKMRLVDHVFDDQVIDSLTVKLILPEGARNIQVDTPYSIQRDPDDLHYTYLDTFGRPVVVAHKKNLVEQHIQDVVVSGGQGSGATIRRVSMNHNAFFT